MQLSLPCGAGKFQNLSASCISAESRRFHVLPRVSAALRSAITPITSSQTTQSSVQSKSDFQRYKAAPKKEDPNSDQNKQQEEHQEKPKLHLVKPNTASIDPETEGESPNLPAEIDPPPVNRMGIASAFFQVIELLHLKKGSLIRWFGTQTYQVGIRKQKRGGTVKKGTMLDQRAE